MQCYCYLCDLAAPCPYWTIDHHCDAEDVGRWKALKERNKKSLAKPSDAGNLRRSSRTRKEPWWMGACSPKVDLYDKYINSV